MKDKDNLQDFVAAYNAMHRWREIKVGGEVLYIGADNYPFPIPLGKNAAGTWVFDTPAGEDEILARRIGKDELTAIAARRGVRRCAREILQHAKAVRAEICQRSRNAKWVVLAGGGGPAAEPI